MYICREELIDKEIEQSVAYMQNVIDLGRVLRDRKTLPMKVGLWGEKVCNIMKKVETRENWFVTNLILLCVSNVHFINEII